MTQAPASCDRAPDVLGINWADDRPSPQVSLRGTPLERTVSNNDSGIPWGCPGSC